MVVNGHKVMFERDMYFKVKTFDVEEGKPNRAKLNCLDDLLSLEKELLHVKLLCLGEDVQPFNVQLEISSDQDLYTLYTHSVDEAKFTEI